MEDLFWHNHLRKNCSNLPAEGKLFGRHALRPEPGLGERRTGTDLAISRLRGWFTGAKKRFNWQGPAGHGVIGCGCCHYLKNSNNNMLPQAMTP